MRSLVFHESLRAEIVQLLNEEHMTCPITAESLLLLVVLLRDYREQGTELYPGVLITDDLPGMLPVLQGQHAILLGQGPREVATVRRMLKTCAPLTQGGWAVYLQRHPESLSFGVFRLPTHPL